MDLGEEEEKKGKWTKSGRRRAKADWKAWHPS
jgi:hypothetical protein